MTLTYCSGTFQNGSSSLFGPGIKIGDTTHITKQYYVSL